MTSPESPPPFKDDPDTRTDDIGYLVHLTSPLIMQIIGLSGSILLIALHPENATVVSISGALGIRSLEGKITEIRQNAKSK